MVYNPGVSPEKLRKLDLPPKYSCVDIDLRPRSRASRASSRAAAGSARPGTAGAPRALHQFLPTQLPGDLSGRPVSAQQFEAIRAVASAASAVRAGPGKWRDDDHAKRAFAAFELEIAHARERVPRTRHHQSHVNALRFDEREAVARAGADPRAPAPPRRVAPAWTALKPPLAADENHRPPMITQHIRALVREQGPPDAQPLGRAR